MDNLETILRQCEAAALQCFYKEPCYAAARAAAQKIIEDGRQKAQQVAVQDLAIRGWIDALRPDAGRERPPLDYYCRLLTAFGLDLPLSFEFSWSLMKAANYYGDSQLVFQVAARLPRQSSSERTFYIFKETAKAHKNAGDFVEAQSCYRAALSLCEKGQHDATIAYFLMLLAKLYNDHQQMLGWHLALHEFSLKRLEEVVNNSSATLGQMQVEKQRRWLQICRDSYAKAIYRERPSDAERLFDKVLSAPRLGEEVRLRIRARELQLRLLHLLAIKPSTSVSMTTVVSEVDEHLCEFHTILDRLTEIGNIRASTVRRVQFLKLARQAVSWSGVLGSEVPEAAMGLAEGGATMEASSARDAALDLSDTKTAARASVEIAMWNSLYLEKSSRSRPTISVQTGVIEELETASALLEDGSLRDYEVYPEILEALGTTQARVRNWSASTEAFELALAQCESAIESVEEDDRRLRAVLAQEEPRQHEMKHLTDDELSSVLNRLRLDYRVVLIRMRDLSRSLRSIQAMHVAEALRRQVSLSKSFRYHEIKGWLDDLEKTEERGMLTAMISQLKARLIRWAREENDHWQAVRFDLGSAIERILAKPQHFVEFQGMVQVASFDNRRIDVYFDEYYLGFILATLLNNIRDAARRQASIAYRATVDLRLERDLVYLEVEDDVGEWERLEQAIKRLNSGRPVVSRKETGGGEGLKLVKQIIEALTGIDLEWKVTAIDDRRKKLSLPLARLSSELR